MGTRTIDGFAKLSFAEQFLERGEESYVNLEYNTTYRQFKSAAGRQSSAQTQKTEGSL